MTSVDDNESVSVPSNSDESLIQNPNIVSPSSIVHQELAMICLNEPVLHAEYIDTYLPCPVAKCSVGILITGKNLWDIRGCHHPVSQKEDIWGRFGRIAISCLGRSINVPALDKTSIVSTREYARWLASSKMYFHWEMDHGIDVQTLGIQMFRSWIGKKPTIPVSFPSQFSDVDDGYNWNLRMEESLRSPRKIFDEPYIQTRWVESLSIGFSQVDLLTFPPETDYLLLSSCPPEEDVYFQIFCRLRHINSAPFSSYFKEIVARDEVIYFEALIGYKYGSYRVTGELVSLFNPKIKELPSGENASNSYWMEDFGYQCTATQKYVGGLDDWDRIKNYAPHWKPLPKYLSKTHIWRRIVERYMELIENLEELKKHSGRYRGVWHASSFDINSNIYNAFCEAQIEQDESSTTANAILEAANSLYDTSNENAVSVMKLISDIKKLRELASKHNSFCVKQLDELLAAFPSGTVNEMKNALQSYQFFCPHAPEYADKDARTDNPLLAFRDKSVAHRELGAPRINNIAQDRNFSAPMHDATFGIHILGEILAGIHCGLFQKLDITKPVLGDMGEAYNADLVWRYYDALPPSKYKVWEYLGSEIANQLLTSYQLVDW